MDGHERTRWWIIDHFINNSWLCRLGTTTPSPHKTVLVLFQLFGRQCGIVASSSSPRVTVEDRSFTNSAFVALLPLLSKRACFYARICRISSVDGSSTSTLYMEISFKKKMTSERFHDIETMIHQLFWTHWKVHMRHARKQMFFDPKVVCLLFIKTETPYSIEEWVRMINDPMIPQSKILSTTKETKVLETEPPPSAMFSS